MINVASLRRGLQIARDYRDLRRAQYYDRAYLTHLQSDKLKRVVYQAYHTVPFYRHLYAGLGIHPESICSISDLPLLPIITKAHLQATPPEWLRSKSFKQQDLDTGMSSGATGQPFPFSRDPYAMRLRKALFLRALSATGYKMGQRLLLFDAPRENIPPKILNWRYVRPTIPVLEQVRELTEFKPIVIYSARPTILRLLAAHCRKAGRDIHSPKAIISTGETLFGTDRAFIEKNFRAPIFDVYGAVEAGTIAWECAAHTGMHVAEDAVLLEFLPTTFSDLGKILVTNLVNMGMPLIRYDIGDLGRLATAGPCSCGSRFSRIARLEGRLVDCILLPNRQVVPPSRFEHALKRVEGVSRFQVKQVDRSTLCVRLETKYNALLEAKAREALQAIVGAQMNLRFETVSDLSPPPGQKFRLVERDPSIDINVEN